MTLSAVQPRVGVCGDGQPDRHRRSEYPASTWQWSSDNSGGVIEDATSDTYTPTAANEGTLTATATYTDPQGPDHTASGDSASPVAADTRNKAPVFDDQDDDTDGIQNAEAERMVAEGAAAEASVDGGAITATDPNADDLVSYTLGGPDASSFDIDASGQITVLARPGRCWTTRPSHRRQRRPYMVKVITARRTRSALPPPCRNTRRDHHRHRRDDQRDNEGPTDDKTGRLRRREPVQPPPTTFPTARSPRTCASPTLGAWWRARRRVRNIGAPVTYTRQRTQTLATR